MLLLIGAFLLFAIFLGAGAIFLSKDTRPPTGPYGVGTISWGPEILSTSHEDAGTQGMPRPMIRLWYPSNTVRSEGYVRQLLRKASGAVNARKIDSADFDAPIASGTKRFPLVVYFPGWPGTRIENYGLACELASHGFIVAGVTYPAKVPGMSKAVHRSQVKELENYPLYTSEEVYKSSSAYSTERVRFRARDASLLLDAFARINASPVGVFAHRVDMERLGIVGFSLGGAVAAETANRDPRIRAAVNIDGRHWGDALINGVEKPYLYIGEELLIPTTEQLTSSNPDERYNAEADKYDYSQLAANLRRNGGIQVTVLKARHMDFTDTGSVSGLRRMIHRNHIDPRRVHLILNTYVLAFLKASLSAEGGLGLFDTNPKFPDVRIDVWDR